MNKKLFKSALFVAAAFVSSIASAAITYDNSVTDAIKGTYEQDANAVVTAGGGSVRANDLIILGGNNGDIPADSEIIVRLPDGLNFDGEPSYLVGPATLTQGLTLQDATEFGDPTLDDPGIELFDTNGDGGMDRALVTVAAANLANDTLTISISLTAAADVTAGTKKASIIVNNGLAVTQNIVDVITADVDPLGNTGDPIEVSQALNEDVDTSGSTFVVTIPAGTAGGKTITLVPASGVQWATTGGSTTITWSNHTPFSVNPLSPVASASVSVNAASATVTAASSTATVTLATNWASTATNESPIQVNVSVSQANSLAGKTGLRKLTVGGTAGVSGAVSLFDALANGSEGTLTTGQTVTTIVAGSSAPQLLPTIQVDENFDDDMGQTVTITAGTGLTFVSVPATTTAGGVTGTVSVNAASTVITISMPSPSVGSNTMTLSGISATVSATASGDLAVTVDGTGTYAPNADKIVVANAVPVGGVSLSVSAAQVKTVGEDGIANSSNITLEEETYGAITTANATQVNDAYFRITPSSNADITAVTVTTAGYNAGTSPTIAVTTACAAETGVTTGAWLCEVEGESTNVQEGTSTVTVNVAYTTDDASVGETVDMTFDGNSGVEGSVTVANVKIATTATVTGVIPDLTPGDTEAAALATITITESFAGAIDAGGTKSIRIIAPTGVSFQDAASSANTTVGTPSITATFGPNDTLIVQVASDTITLDSKAIIADGLSGLLTFKLVDGDIDGNNGAGITGEEVIIAYAGDLDALDAGDDGDVNVGFMISNTVAGGLADYTVASSDSDIASVAIDGDTIMVTGKAVGNVTVTVTDELNATDTFSVDVAAGAAQTAAEKVVGAEGASFSAGASSDGGESYADEFTAGDSITMVATINVDPDHQGLDGAVHVAILAVAADGKTSLSYLDEDSVFVEWDTSAGLPGAHIVAEPLAETYSVTVFDGPVAAGTYRVAVAYTTEDGDLVYAPKALIIEVSE